MDYPGLTKWPALMVEGSPVTVEQGEEICLRTMYGHYLSTNDRAFEREVHELFGVRQADHAVRDSWKGEWEDWEAFDKRIARVPLNYLHNDQICSAYIGGPHGWCDWQGRIGTSPAYNIGKWPSCEEVADELTLIAEAFPYLDMRVQLHDGEECEENTRPVVEWVVKEGAVTHVEVGTPIVLTPGKDLRTQLAEAIYMPASYRERGITIEHLAEVYHRVVEKIGGAR